jgi:voltage-gated potassium channel
MLTKYTWITNFSWSQLLLVEVFCTAFLVGFFPAPWHPTIYSILYTLVYFTAVMNLDINRARRFKFAFVLMLVQWLARFFDFDTLRGFSMLLDSVFFIYIVAAFIGQLVRAKAVTERVILQAINGYLLLGISFSMLIAMMSIVDVQAFGYADGRVTNLDDYIYYSFVTLGTLGYGDMLPFKPYAKSLAILTTVSGQLYLAIIVALLVSKLSNKQPELDKDS